MCLCLKLPCTLPDTSLCALNFIAVISLGILWSRHTNLSSNNFISPKWGTTEIPPRFLAFQMTEILDLYPKSKKIGWSSPFYEVVFKKL